jgi:hypothetical protein
VAGRQGIDFWLGQKIEARSHLKVAKISLLADPCLSVCPSVACNDSSTVALAGVVVSVLATGPKVRGFKPGRGWGDKIHSTPSFGGEVKPSVPCRRYTACKRTLRAR